jgi:hypothetical protein
MQAGGAIRADAAGRSTCSPPLHRRPAPGRCGVRPVGQSSRHWTQVRLLREVFSARLPSRALHPPALPPG